VGPGRRSTSHGARPAVGHTEMEQSLKPRVVTLFVVLAVALAVSSCAAGRAFNRGMDAVRAGDWDAAVAYLTRAVQEAPNRPEYRIQLERAMLEASRQHFDRARAQEAAGNLEQAIVSYRRVTEYDPSNRQAILKVVELERLLRDQAEAARPRPPIDEMRERARRQAQAPLLNPASREPIYLKFEQASTQDILRFIGDATGINVTFERDFRPQPFSIQLEGVTLEQALNQILTANQLWYKVINERTILVIPDTQQKRQMYEEQVVRTFYISHADPQEMAQLLSQIARVPGLAVQPTIAASKTANTITVRATRGMAEIIEQIIRSNDKPRAEIIVDVEILEVNRSRARQYGLNLSQYQIGAIFSPELEPGATGAPIFNLNTITRGISPADFYMAVPSAVVRFLATDSLTRQIAKPQLRGTEGQKLTLNLGDEIPVPSTVFTPIATGGAATNPLTSFTYRSVGVNVEMTPRVTYEGEIVLDIFVESSNLGESVVVAGQPLPSFGSRKVTTRLRLREGESNLLAGLLRENDRRQLRGIPGVMNLPVLRQLLSDNDNAISQTDIVMLLTPRIVRTHELTEENLAPIYIGTQQNIGLAAGPQLIAPQPDAVQEISPGAPWAPGLPGAPGVGPVPPPAPGAAPPGVPRPPAAAPPGAPRPETAAPPGAGVAGTPPGTVRMPDGTVVQPQAPPGTSPIPGTTTEPPAPPPPVPEPPPVADPGVPPEPELIPPEVIEPEAPPATAPVEPTPPAGAAQIVMAPSGTEFRVGGGPYTVPISVVNASRMSIVSLSISFNPAVVRVRAVQEGSFLRQGGIPVTFTQSVDGAAGRIDITMTRTGDTTGASGAGLLAAVLFEPVAPGSLTLTPSAVATDAQGAPVRTSAAPVTITVR
jgi:general secretion pathway protein D